MKNVTKVLESVWAQHIVPDAGPLRDPHEIVVGLVNSPGWLRWIASAEGSRLALA